MGAEGSATGALSVVGSETGLLSIVGCETGEVSVVVGAPAGAGFSPPLPSLVGELASEGCVTGEPSVSVGAAFAVGSETGAPSGLVGVPSVVVGVDTGEGCETGLSTTVGVVEPWVGVITGVSAGAEGDSSVGGGPADDDGVSCSKVGRDTGITSESVNTGDGLGVDRLEICEGDGVFISSGLNGKDMLLSASF